MNMTRRIIVAAFITMLLCNVVVAYTYRPMPSRSDYKDYGSYRDAYTQRAMDDYQQMADDRQPVPTATRDQQWVEDQIARPSQDKCPDRYQQSEAKRKIQEQIEEHEQFPYGIPKPTKPISYGKRTYDAPCPTPEQSPSMNTVSVIAIIASMALLLRRRTQ